jgi:hypothetical protein
MRDYVRLTNCSDGNCPGFDQWLDTGDFRVTGYKVAPEDKTDAATTEDVVTVPRNVVLQLVAQMQQRCA